MTRGQHLHGSERITREALFVSRKRENGRLCEMDLAPLEHRERFRTHDVNQPHLHVGIALGVATQQIGKDAFDEVR